MTVSNPALFSEGTEFGSLPGGRLFWQMQAHGVSTQNPPANAGVVLI
jgi:hypothetical protein